ncbi:MAG: DUF2264 domain-containing protein, partial [Clostridium sp.]|nr:DUF2264 domain-containing protein [Clostridium sp.]
RNLRYWFNEDIFSSDGLLTIGYGYQNLNMAEGYNAPGSPYWACKVFLILALPYDHPFWTSEEEELHFDEKSVQKSPRMIVCHNKNGREVQAFTSGQHAHEHAHTDAKYEKFVYSTTFGFSVPKGRLMLHQGAYDSTLALSECDGYYRTRYGCESYDIHDDYIESVWKPWNDVTIRSIIIPAMPWHIRIHVIDTERTLDTAEGGFSAPAWVGNKDVHDGRTFYKFNDCITGIKDLNGFRKGEMIEPEPNTSMLFPRTVLPTLTGRLNPGKHVLCCAVLGAVGEDNDFDIDKNPSVTLDGDYAVVNAGGKEIKIKIK